MAKSKKDKLEKLDGLLLDKMIEIMESKDGDALGALASLSTPMNYLRNNSVIADKPKSTVEEETKKRLEAAEERRKKGASK